MFNERDLSLFKAFKKVIDVTDFEIKGEAIEQMAFLKKWFNGLETRILEDIQKAQQPALEAPKPTHPLIKKTRGKK